MKLELIKIEKKYGKKEVLKGIDYTFTPGVYGLVGPNGAGKTTLIRCLIDIISHKGKVLLNDKETGKKNDICLYMGYLPQSFGMYPELTCAEALDYLYDMRKLPVKDKQQQIEHSLAVVGLQDDAGKKVKALSGGMLRRLGIAATLIGDSPILIFDEPTAGLDPGERIRFHNIIRSLSRDKIIILSTHIMPDVEQLCDTILVFHRGTIAATGTPSQMAQYAQDKVFEIDADQCTPQMIVVSLNNTAQGCMARVLCQGDYPNPQQPTVTDGYLWITGGVQK